MATWPGRSVPPTAETAAWSRSGREGFVIALASLRGTTDSAGRSRDGQRSRCVQGVGDGAVHGGVRAVAAIAVTVHMQPVAVQTEPLDLRGEQVEGLLP